MNTAVPVNRRSFCEQTGRVAVTNRLRKRVAVTNRSQKGVPCDPVGQKGSPECVLCASVGQNASHES